MSRRPEQPEGQARSPGRSPNIGFQFAGQGIQPLQTALHSVGPRTAVTSLRQVDDARRRELMQRFYTSLWVDGLPVAEALWSAKTAQRAAGMAPRDWAGRVLCGALD